MRVYIVEYRTRVSGEWSGKISQEGYKTLAGAQEYIEARPGNPRKITPMLYAASDAEEYRVHDILIK